MKIKSFLAAVALSTANFTLVNAAEPPKPAVPLIAQAKIERATAEKTALARVPGGHIKEGELEQEHGRLVWSFDIMQPTSPNIIEVQVDAISGKVVSLVTETPADQAKEAAADRAKADKKP
ncbi:MAG: PepSY domain-containing protein [Gammaproteobacteria bacterium]